MEDLTVGLVVAIHERIVAEGGFDPRILSEACLYQLVFQANLVPEIVPRAALVFYSLCAFPAFRDGNRETALAVAQEILASCGRGISGELSGVMVLADGIESYSTEPEDVEAWFCANVTNKEKAP
jgi:prophage maintenance system killer protein